MNEITLKWTKPSNCDPSKKKTLSYKIVYKKLNFSRILGDDDTADISDANTMIVDGNIGGTPVESTTLKGLESLSEYLITIEAVVSNKTISQPPPPKIIINNQRSMQVVWTKPKPPVKLLKSAHRQKVHDFKSRITHISGFQEEIRMLCKRAQRRYPKRLR